MLLLLGRLGAGAWGGIGPLEGALLIAGLAIALTGVPLLKGGESFAAVAEEPDYRAPEAASAAISRGARWVSRALWILCLVVYIGYLGVYVTYAADLFRWPYDYDQGESFELYDAVLHSEGKWPYQDSSRFPFYSSNYPPVFHIMNIALFPLLGKTLLSGRVLSFSITLLTAAMIGLTVHRRTGSLPIAGLAGLAYPASNFIYHVGPLSRQHLTMVFLETLAVYFIAGANDRQHGRRNTLIGLACLLLAGFSKQLAVFTAAAIFIYLFLISPKRSVALALAFGAVFGAIFLGINLATDGQWWINTISANVNPFLLPQLIGLVQSWAKIHAVFVLLGLAMVLYEVYAAGISVYSLWFLMAIGTGIMSGKWGAGEAYWATSVAVAGFALGRLTQWAAGKPAGWHTAIRLALPLLLLAQATRMIHLPTEGVPWGALARVLGVAGRSSYADYPYYDAVGYSQVGHLMLPRDYEGGERIMAHVRATEGLVFSEEAAFTMLAGKPVVTNPTQLLNLYNAGLLDTSELERMIREEAFGLVIMRAQFYPPPVLAAIGEHYGLVEHIPMNGFAYIIMKPLEP